MQAGSPVLPGWAWTLLKTAVVLVVLVASRHVAGRVRPERYVVISWVVLIPLIAAGGWEWGKLNGLPQGPSLALGGVTSIAFNAVIGSIIDRFGYDAPFWFGACLHPIAAGVLAWHFLRRNKGSDASPHAS